MICALDSQGADKRVGESLPDVGHDFFEDIDVSGQGDA